MEQEKPGSILIERMKLLACCKNYEELASRLGVKRSVLTRCRRQGTLSPELRGKLEFCGINPEWVENESGPKYLTGEEGPEKNSLLREEPLHYLVQRALREFKNEEPDSDDKILH